MVELINIQAAFNFNFLAIICKGVLCRRYYNLEIVA